MNPHMILALFFGVVGVFLGLPAVVWYYTWGKPQVRRCDAEAARNMRPAGVFGSSALDALTVALLNTRFAKRFMIASVASLGIAAIAATVARIG